jgi:hypothetical protein
MAEQWPGGNRCEIILPAESISGTERAGSFGKIKGVLPKHRSAGVLLTRSGLEF